MMFLTRKALSMGVLILALGGITGCLTVGFMTKREAVAIVDHALAQSGCTRQDVGIDSSYGVTVDRFQFQAKEYEVTVDTTHDQDRVEKSYRRGRKKNERNINIPWSAVTRVIAKGSNLPYGETSYQSVQFFFMTRDAKGDMIEDSYIIGGLVQNVAYVRDAVSELALAIKTLAGLEPAARGDYERRYSADYGTSHAWKTTTPTGTAATTAPALQDPQPLATPPRESRPTAVAVPPSNNEDATERELRKLKDLKDQGLISDEVYKERQMEILKAGS